MIKPQDELALDVMRRMCPDCGAAKIADGPRGGLSVNVTCEECGARFNAHGGAEDITETFMVDRLSDGDYSKAWRRRARERYRDDTREQKTCLHCLMQFRGPALYCSLSCAEADA